jgi:Na+-translocating ferredoxin:NAD+ oxidoreductase RnfA subunit
MEFLLDLLQGAGIAAAIGIRPALPVLLVGALATANLGVDFGGTAFAFLESWPFLLGAVVLVVLLDLVTRRGGDAARPVWMTLLALALVLGALLGAGSLADRGHPVVAGLVVGIAAAALGFFAARTLFTRARRRLDADAANTLPLYGEAAALGAAGVSVLAPPLALLVIGGLAWLLVGSRRREDRKYAGLRILR